MTPPPPTSAGKPRPRVRGSGGRAVLPLVPGFERTPTRTRPLPDAAAVRLVVVPDSAPPYDDGRAVSPAGRREPPEPLRARERLGMSLPDAPEPGRDRGRAGKAAAAGWPSQFAQVLAETLAGSRPQGQITPWTTDQARRLIRQLGPMLAAENPRPRRAAGAGPAAPCRSRARRQHGGVGLHGHRGRLNPASGRGLAATDYAGRRGTA
jgi:hypothetical protein